MPCVHAPSCLTLCFCQQTSILHRQKCRERWASAQEAWPSLPAGCIFYFTYLFLAVLGPHCHAGFSLTVASRACSPVAAYGLLTERGFSCCGAQLSGTQASAAAVPRIYSASSVVVVQRLSGLAACGIGPDQGSNPCLLHWQGCSPLSPKKPLLHFKSRSQSCCC